MTKQNPSPSWRTGVFPTPSSP
ncbi:uncharacterized protein FTOL_13894 [Fusarium torulosum]|uniref:Uncharacterized protein n=1 Tax=Fusarium torulosum TaxID=33205 RepID=A0AAE8SQN8_9HYPO|nr:uncharacterized protein FTOL_13894 [Fusarium torulosum]